MPPISGTKMSTLRPGGGPQHDRLLRSSWDCISFAGSVSGLSRIGSMFGDPLFGDDSHRVLLVPALASKVLPTSGRFLAAAHRADATLGYSWSIEK